MVISDGAESLGHESLDCDSCGSGASYQRHGPSGDSESLDMS